MLQICAFCVLLSQTSEYTNGRLKSRFCCASPVLFFTSQVIELSHSELVEKLQLGSYDAVIVFQASRFMGGKVSYYH